MGKKNHQITRENFDAVLFDLDGVLTDTATVHASCWKKMFDRFLENYSRTHNLEFQAFDIDKDYKCYVDGKPRYEGVESFLRSRDIILPYGSPESGGDETTICGLGNLKTGFVKEVLASDGVAPYQGSVSFVKNLVSDGFSMAVVSSSQNCLPVLEAAGIDGYFECRVDGNVAMELGLKGKPAPDTFLYAARELGVTPERAIVVEDAVSGVQAGRSGGFGLVIGVDRGGNREALKKNGADMVINDLADLKKNTGDRYAEAKSTPST